MMKIESEQQLNRFPWQQNLMMNEPSAMDLLRQGKDLFYDGIKVFYFDDKGEQRDLFFVTMKF